MEDTQNTVETVDNSASEEITQEIVNKYLDEPTEETVDEKPVEEAKTTETVEETQEDEQKDNTYEYPEKFMKGGKLDTEGLSKSYTELEKLHTRQQAEWQKERADLLKAKEKLDELNKRQEENAKQSGFETVSDMQHAYELANYEANEYAKYINYVDVEEQQRVLGLLRDYANNPSEDLLNEIEEEFPLSVVKRISVESDRKASQFESEKAKNAETAKMTHVESIIQEAVAKDREMFDFEPFAQMTVNVLDRFGDRITNEDFPYIVNVMKQYGEKCVQDYINKQGTVTENNKATDKLAAISTKTSAQTPAKNPDITNMSDMDLGKLVREYI